MPCFFEIRQIAPQRLVSLDTKETVDKADPMMNNEVRAVSTGADIFGVGIRRSANTSRVEMQLAAVRLVAYLVETMAQFLGLSLFLVETLLWCLELQ